MLNRPLKYLQFCRAVGLDGLLAELDRLGVRTGVLSDYPAEAKLRALGLEGRFSPVLCATDPEIGAFKPSPRGFLRACAVWNLPPRDVLFVGDRVDVDAAGAAAAGMRCVIIGRQRPRARARLTWCFHRSKGFVVSLTITEGRTSAGIRPYVQIARVDHWFKNAFMLLGVVLAVFYEPQVVAWSSVLPLVLAVAATCLVASSNYVLNELLDGPRDRLHPEKGIVPCRRGR